MKIQKKDGFTLIEILVAITFFDIALLGLAMGTATVIRTNQNSHLQASAVNLAQGKIEEIRAMSTAASGALACADYTTAGCYDSPTASGATFSRSWKITADSPATGISTVDVKVDWTDYSSRTVTVSASFAQ